MSKIIQIYQDIVQSNQRISNVVQNNQDIVQNDQYRDIFQNNQNISIILSKIIIFIEILSKIINVYLNIVQK